MIKALILFSVVSMTMTAKGQDMKTKALDQNNKSVPPATLINENYVRMLTKPRSKVYILAGDTLMKDAAKEIITEKSRWTIVNNMGDADFILDLRSRAVGSSEDETSVKIIDPNNDDRAVYETAVISADSERDINGKHCVFRKLYESITSI